MSLAGGGKVGEAYVELHYRLDTLNKDLKTAQTTVATQVEELKRVADERSSGMFGSVNSAIEGISSKLGVIGGLAVTAFAVQGARAIGQFALGVAEAGTKVDLIRAKLTAIVGERGFDLAAASAGKLGVSIDDSAGAMARFGLAGKDLGLTDQQIQTMTENFIKLARISGATGEELAASMQQFGQALGSGALRGDELNSVFEQTPEVIRTIAAALNVPVGKIREMAEEGKLTASVITSALLGATDQIQERFGKLPETLEQGQARWENAWTLLMAALDDKFHASDFFKFVTGGAAAAIEKLAVGLGGGDAGAQERALASQIADLQSRRGLAGMRSPSGAAEIDRQIEELQTKLGELRLQSFTPSQPAPFVDIATGKLAASERTPEQKAQDQKNLDAAIKLKQDIEEHNIKIQQDSLKSQLDDWEEAEKKKKAASEKAATERAAATRKAQGDADSLIKQAATSAETYAATIERLDGYLKKGQISQEKYNEAAAAAKTIMDKANEAAARKEQADKEREEQQRKRAAREAEQANEKLKRDREERQAAEQKMMDQWKEQDPRGYFQATEDPELARVYDLQSGVEGAFKDMQDSALEFGRIGGQAVNAMADTAANAITRWVTGAKVDLKELADALMQDVIQQFLTLAIKGAIGAGFGSLFNSGGGGTNTIQTSYTGGKGYGGGYFGDYGSYAKGGVFNAGMVTPMARGGIVDRSHLVPLARGAALIGEAGPEGVLPLRRNSKGQLGVMHDGSAGGGGGGGSTFVLNDQRGTGSPPIETRERRGPDGSRVIEATIRDLHRKGVSRGDHDQAYGERYGMKPTPVK